MLIVEVSPGDVDFDHSRGPSDRLRTAYMRRRWPATFGGLPARYETIAPTVAADLIRFREAAQASSAHRRTPEIAAQLAIGWRWWLSYAVEVGAMTND